MIYTSIWISAYVCMNRQEFSCDTRRRLSYAVETSSARGSQHHRLGDPVVSTLRLASSTQRPRPRHTVDFLHHRHSWQLGPLRRHPSAADDRIQHPDATRGNMLWCGEPGSDPVLLPQPGGSASVTICIASNVLCCKTVQHLQPDASSPASSRHVSCRSAHSGPGSDDGSRQ